MNENILWGYIIAALCAIALITIYLLFKIKKRKPAKLLKIFAAVAGSVFVLRYMWNYMPITYRAGMAAERAFLDFTDATLIWFISFNILTVVFNSVFDIKLLKIYNRYFALPISLYTLIMYQLIAPAIDPNLANGFSIKAILLGLETGLIFGLSAAHTLEHGKLNITLKEALAAVALWIPMILVCIPAEYPMQIINSGKVFLFDNLGVGHRVVLYIGIVVPITLYFALKDKPLVIRRFALFWIAFATYITFTRQYTFQAFTYAPDLPLHLCHTAMYLIPLCLVFKMKRLFYFTYFINVLGAMLATLMPDIDPTLAWTAPRVWRFFINHLPAYFMPLLMVALGIYPRPTFRQFRYAMAGFALYFCTVLIVNAWFTNYRPEKPVDFFFINASFIVDRFGLFGRWLKGFTFAVNVGDLVLRFYPVYQVLFFIVYCLGGLATWFLFELGFSTAENYRRLARVKNKIRQDEIAFMSRLNGRPRTQPINQEGIDMLKLKDFYKRYGSNAHYSVAGANLEVKDGEIFGFLGPNGAGKSTIIKSIVGIQPPTSGTVEICGYDIIRQSTEAKLNVGFVPDHYALYEKLTGRQYINYIADIYKVPKEERDVRIEDMLNKFQLSHAFDNKIKTYSHGMKQKIAIMAALTHRPKVWILDEPLTGLDPNSIYQVKEMMKQYAREGNIVFFSSHIIDVVEKICDRIAIIKKGEIKTDVTIKELEDKKIKLEDYYLSIIGEVVKG